ncbi:MAG: hypothetical protein EHM39_04330 [Chloroflexi bacterium]|nr:MAG: hypothetical protein EHM39_04330 [Chloroflexota bacterium]
MDPNTRPIQLALLAVLGFALLAFAASLVVPFNVTKPAAVYVQAGSAERVIAGHTPEPLLLDSVTHLEAGHSLRILPTGETRVTFEINEGWAVLIGPAALTLTESFRHATMLGHVSDRFEREYVLTLEQTAGRIRYNFSDANPSFTESTITIRLPDGRYTPDSPCWTIEISEEHESRIESSDCSTSDE